MPVHFSLGCLPPTLNEIIDTARRSRNQSAASKKVWTDYIATKALALKPLTDHPHVYLECVWYIKNFARDPDNVKAASKFIMDGLVNASVLRDDTLAIVKSPIIHWFQKVSNYDALTFIFYTEDEWKERLSIGIDIDPDAYFTQPVQEVPNFVARLAKVKSRRKRTTSNKPRKIPTPKG